MDDVNKGPIGEARDFIETYFKHELVEVTEPGTGTAALFEVTPKEGYRVISANSFDTYRERPVRRKGTAHLLSLDSLIEHSNRFSDSDSVIFADDDRKAPSITTVLDYHRAQADGDPRFGVHRNHFAFPLSDEWQAWTKSNSVVMKMAQFAEFLEDRIIDVLHLIPGEDDLSEELKKFISAGGGEAIIATPQKLFELARGLKVNEEAVVQEAVTLASGEGQVRFEVSHRDGAGAPLRVPSLFLIAIPVFRNDMLYRLAARLRYRKTAEGIVFWYDLWRADRTFDHAFKEACERVRVETELPLFYGKPEA
jgi:hypothetical protein